VTRSFDAVQLGTDAVVASKLQQKEVARLQQATAVQRQAALNSMTHKLEERRTELLSAACSLASQGASARSEVEQLEVRTLGSSSARLCQDMQCRPQNSQACKNVL
jgi:hypothetical protein